MHLPAAQSAAEVEWMLQTMAHRGPNDRGTWAGEGGGSRISLGHLRLSIIDLSAGGHQPMSTHDGAVTVVFNGEIYNYRELRAELALLGRVFSSESDTEVILHAYQVWGLGCFERFNGMWAIALVDLTRKELILSRDRFGEKPLYYHRAGTKLRFASEIKGLLLPGEKHRPNKTVIARYLGQFLLNAQDETFVDGVTMLPAGTYAVLPFDLAGLVQLRPVSYWRPTPRTLSAAEIEDLPNIIWEQLLDAVRLRLRSDVPVGLLLSGGVDSSALAAAMKLNLGNSGQLNLISAISSSPEYSEETHISQVARFLGEKSHCVNVETEGVSSLSEFEKAIYWNDQPLGSFSAAAHLRLMRYCKDLGITVVLSGQGADEIAFGYRKYAMFYLQDQLRRGKVFDAVRFISMAFANQSSLVAQFNWSDAKRYVRGPFHGRGQAWVGSALKGDPELLDITLGAGGMSERRIRDLYHYSVPSLTHYEDRMSMAHAREIRLPFLDPRVVDLFVSIPTEQLLHDGWSKWALRRAMEGRLPDTIVWRRDKQGFLNPERKWLAEQFRGGVETVFDGPLLIEQLGYVDKRVWRNLVRRYCSQPHGHKLISEKEILHPVALELWLRRFSDSLDLS